MTVGNGALASAGNAFIAGDTVLVGLAHQLTGSTVYGGMLSSMMAMGWLWPQLIVGSLVEHVERKKPVYVYTAVVRLASLIALTLLLFSWHGGARPLFWLILLLVAAYSSAGGVCGVPFMDIVGKTIPQKRRSVLFAYRRLIGGVLGFFAGLMVHHFLAAKDGTPTTRQYALLVACAAAVSGLAYAMFTAVREPVEPVAAARVPFLTFLRRGPTIFRHDANYRWFYLYKCFWALGTMSQVLFVPYAVEHMGAPYRLTGWFSAVVMLAAGVSSVVWGHLSQRRGEVALLKWSAVINFASPLMALLLAGMLRHTATAALVKTHYLWAYIIMFGCGTAAINGAGIGNMVYLLAISPPKRRPTYVAFVNTLSAPLVCAPILAGILARTLSYELTFALSAAATLISLCLTFLLRKKGHSDLFEDD